MPDDRGRERLGGCGDAGLRLRIRFSGQMVLTNRVRKGIIGLLAVSKAVFMGTNIVVF